MTDLPGHTHNPRHIPFWGLIVVRCGNVQPINVMQKQVTRSMLLLIGINIILAIFSRGLPASLSTPIPVANFYDRVSGTSANGIYFLGMYIASAALLPAALTATRGVVLAGITVAKRLLCAFVFLIVFAFCTYLCVFMPATTTIGGGRFSVLLAASAKWPLAYGVIYGLLCYCALFFLVAALASIAGRRPLTADHT